MQKLLTPSYQEFIKSCKDTYHVSPAFYHRRLQEIIRKLEIFSGCKYEVIVESPLPAPALSEHPNIIRISPSMIVLDSSIVAQIMAHEFGHHHHGHMQKNTPLIQAEYEADSYSVKFLMLFNYDLQIAREYRLNMLKPSDMRSDTATEFYILHTMVEKAFDEGISKKSATFSVKY